MDRLDPARIRAIDEQMQCHVNYCWAMGDEQVRAAHGGRVVVVVRQAVWGSGANSIEAAADAESKPGCPPFHEFTFVSVPQGDEDSLDPMFLDEWPSGDVFPAGRQAGGGDGDASGQDGDR